MNSEFENDMEKYDCESVGCPSIVPHEITVCVPITVKAVRRDRKRQN